LPTEHAFATIRTSHFPRSPREGEGAGAIGYRGKVKEQAKARQLRAQNRTVADIAKALGVSKSSVSLWVRAASTSSACVDASICTKGSTSTRQNPSGRN
jgi:Homeodomain-like domain